MLTWRVDRGVIAELHHAGRNLIRPWGIETADSSGFFSLEPGIGYRHEREVEEYEGDHTRSASRHVVRMPEGYWSLRTAARVEGTVLHRQATLHSLEDTILMDFVMRFRFRREFFSTAQIAGKTIQHRRSDVYHQYAVRSARLDGPEMSVVIEIENASCGRVMQPMLYVRDHADEWVVHARMLPSEHRKEVIKVCNGWAGTRSLPSWMSGPILAVPGLRTFLRYRNERKPYPRIIGRLFNPNAFPMAMLSGGESLAWNVRMSLV
ncbi:hypothetical protein HNQ60_000102 [Povalibacter uvarum]|uniref:Uncharacterized protein n=1 Tax=Povalibacter uvarum TaxID=732238 RepID=A0A841HES1_9GAMM|nr:hypothetical protein [Povalibacter uvarum]MBB6091256.1 hypothetical protein [Povalibacter uvarum]